MVDEKTVNGILDRIRNRVPAMDWDYLIKYHNGEDTSVTELRLFRKSSTSLFGKLIFNSSSGKMIRGNYRKNLRFPCDIDLTDALLDVLSFELNKAA